MGSDSVRSLVTMRLRKRRQGTGYRLQSDSVRSSVTMRLRKRRQGKGYRLQSDSVRSSVTMRLRSHQHNIPVIVVVHLLKFSDNAFRGVGKLNPSILVVITD